MNSRQCLPVAMLRTIDTIIQVIGETRRQTNTVLKNLSDTLETHSTTHSRYNTS